jgi:hypothetical protein
MKLIRQSILFTLAVPNVPWPKRAIMVDKNEAWDCSLCYRMRHLSKGKGKSPQTWRFAAAIEYSCLEAERCQYGFYRRHASDCLQVWLHLGDCWSIHEVCSLYSCSYPLQGKEICRAIHWAHYMSAWGAQHHHLWPRSSVHCSFLGAVACFSVYSPDPQFDLSPIDRWSNRACEPSARRHALCMCDELPRQLEQVPAIGWIFLQHVTPGF